MTRAKPLLLCSWLAMLGACTSSAGDANERAKQPDPPTLAPEPTPSEAPSVDKMNEALLDELARECDGLRLREQFAVRSPAELDQLAVAEPASIRLLAIWERDRSFADLGPLVATSLDRLVPALETALGEAPPQWWIDQLGSATRRDSKEPPYYDGLMTEHGDRRGKWQVGPGGARVRSAGAMLLSETAGQLSYDLSMGRVVLGPLPTEPGAMIEHARAQRTTTTYYSTFSQGSGGFRFPLWAIESDGSRAWTAEVCGPDRQILGGVGHLIVEIVVLASGKGIAVFTAESHGVALDVFDPVTGARTLAWSSDFWFNR
jgi:hypothetical protein